MKKSRFGFPTGPLLGLSLFVLPGIAFHSQNSADNTRGGYRAATTKITNVLLFSRQAIVTRRGSLSWSAGGSPGILVTGLPIRLDPRSVRARLLNQNGLEIEGVTLEERYARKTENPEAIRARENLETAREQLQSLLDRRQALNRVNDFLRELRLAEPVIPDDIQPEFTVAPGNWRRVLNFLAEQMETWKKSTLDIEKQIDAAQEEVVVAGAALRQLRSKARLDTRDVFIKFKPEQAKKFNGKISFEINYLVKDAAWFPRYEIKADAGTKKIDLTGYALVRQETGEDWTGVELSFSAAQPEFSTNIPELKSWFIAALDRPAATRYAAKEQKADESRAPMEMEEEAADYAGVGPTISNRSSSSMGAGFASNSTPARSKAEYSRRAKKKVYQKAGKDYRPRARRTANIIHDMEQKLAEQKPDFDKGNFDDIIQSNEMVLRNYNRLTSRQQQRLSGYRQEAEDNIQRALRLKQGNRLARNLIQPARSSRGFDWRYQSMTKGHRIPSDGSLNKVPLFRHQMAADFLYESAPLRDDGVFLTALAKNQKREPLLAGPTTVFLGREYMGQGFLETTAKNEEFRVHLGLDENIKINRKERRKQSTTGIISTNYRLLYEVEIEINNSKSKPVRLVLVDRIPFTSDKDINIELREMNLEKGLTWARDSYKKRHKGILEMRLKLSKGSQKKIRWSYRVEHPEETKLLFRPDSHGY